MQRDFNNRDFEQFVKQNADQYRMFPSEKVWQGINGALHTRRRWYGLGLGLLLLLTGTAVTLVMVSTPENKTTVKANTTFTQADKSGDNLSDDGTITASSQRNTPPSPANPSVNSATVSPFASSETNFELPVVSTNRTTAPFTAQQIAGIAGAVNGTTTASVNNNNSIAGQKANSTLSVNVDVPSTVVINHAQPVVPLVTTETAAADAGKQKQTTSTATQTDIYPLTIESVVNSYQPSVKKKKFSMQFYLTPTISYRKLSENKKFLQSAADNGMIPVYAAYSDINNYVSHKPDMGLELGFAGKYALTDNFKLRAGIQFNVSRYDIKAAYEQRREDATIALDGGTFGGNQTIIRQTNYRNFNGNNPMNWLKNLYYSVSLPVGAEITFNSRSKTHFGVAATFQPTYIIKDRAYLISTDYKNYVEVPSLVRKFNMNSSFETFVAYSTRNINWQIGPQIRYQLQSSFTKRYPFKENLFDFGLKVGIQLNR